MHTLYKAAREMTERTLKEIHVRGGGENDEDLISALRQQETVEVEISQLETLITAAWKVAKMKHPSIEHILRSRDFGFEADRLAELVKAVESIPIRE